MGLSVGGLRAGLIRRWHGRLGLVSVALLIASATTLAKWFFGRSDAFGPLGLAGWLLWVVWTVAYGVLLIRLDPEVAEKQKKPRLP
ncbi:hypothetical protein ACH4TX_20080 [Streptomyces sp. NPDC021098]|uniref:hypothetical protein n=1 Tax=unclassified Streptomyces TaxID=2593676 RepID=UPI0037A51BDD